MEKLTLNFIHNCQEPWYTKHSWKRSGRIHISNHSWVYKHRWSFLKMDCQSAIGRNDLLMVFDSGMPWGKASHSRPRVVVHLREMSRVGKSVGTVSALVVAWAGAERWWGIGCKMYRQSFWADENILKYTMMVAQLYG